MSKVQDQWAREGLLCPLDGVQAYLKTLTKWWEEWEPKDEDEMCAWPDGSSTATCTNSAILVAEKFGGRVVGYHHEDNPKALLGQGLNGHDFALLFNDRLIVDWWATAYRGVFSDPEPDSVAFRYIVSHGYLENLSAYPECPLGMWARELYGDPKLWKPAGGKLRRKLVKFPD
jgi:hypothetical protein